MYFDIIPKTKKEDLFGADFLVNTLISQINDKNIRMIVIKGLRRTGKSSVLNVILNEIKQKYVKIDVREAPYYDRKEFMVYLIEKIKAEIGEPIFKKIIKHISGIRLSYKEVSVTFYLEIEKNFLLFFEKLNKQFENSCFVLAFDEVQLLNKIDFNYPLAAIYDNYKNIKLILTGSEIGIIDEFLGKKDAESPLFGRAMIEVGTKKLDNEQVSRFLTLGFNQIEKNINLKEIKEVIEAFDGIIGWVTYYGWLRSNNFNHYGAISEVSKEGSKLTRKELDKFLERRKKATYLKLLKWIAKGYNSWNLLKSQFAKEGIKISDRQLGLYLEELINYGFVEKERKNYLIPDPLLVKGLFLSTVSY